MERIQYSVCLLKIACLCSLHLWSISTIECRTKIHCPIRRFIHSICIEYWQAISLLKLRSLVCISIFFNVWTVDWLLIIIIIKHWLSIHLRKSNIVPIWFYYMRFNACPLHIKYVLARIQTTKYWIRNIHWHLAFGIEYTQIYDSWFVWSE